MTVPTASGRPQIGHQQGLWSLRQVASRRTINLADTKLASRQAPGQAPGRPPAGPEGSRRQAADRWTLEPGRQHQAPRQAPFKPHTAHRQRLAADGRTAQLDRHQAVVVVVADVVVIVVVVVVVVVAAVEVAATAIPVVVLPVVFVVVWE